MITDEFTKHTARPPYLVTEAGGLKSSLTKIIHSNPSQKESPKLSPYSKTVDNKFVTVVRRTPKLSEDYPFRPEPDKPSSTKNQGTTPWHPITNYSESDSDFSEDEEIINVITQEEVVPGDYARGELKNPPVSDQSPNTNDNQNLIRDGKLKKNDRVTFFNDLTDRWTTARITSGPVKYYRNVGPYYNFVADDGTKGGHYFHSDGLWSRLDDVNQLPLKDATYQLPPPEIDIAETSFFIDDDYDDQEELSQDNSWTLNSTAPIMFYPSAASFPDLDLEIPAPMTHRSRLTSSSEPDLTTQGCHHSIRQRLRKWGSALVDAWASTDDLHTRHSTLGDRGDGEERETATPPLM